MWRRDLFRPIYTATVLLSYRGRAKARAYRINRPSASYCFSVTRTRGKLTRITYGCVGLRFAKS